MKVLGKIEQVIRVIFRGVTRTVTIDPDVAYTPTGTATISGSVSVVGSGTAFDTDLTPGQSITIAGETRLIDTISNATNLDVTVAFSGSSGGNAISATPHVDTVLTVKSNGPGSDEITTNFGQQELRNKDINSDNNTITNIVDADIKAGAAIDATKIADGSVTNTELQYINSLSSNAQDQLDNKPDSGSIVDADINAGAAIDAAKIGGGGVSTTEYDYLGGVTSDIQTQLDSKLSGSELTTHEGDTSTHGVGEIVGTTETQTLSGKTLTNPIIDGSEATTYTEQTAGGPSAPAAGKHKIYFRDSDSALVKLNSADEEVVIGSGAGGSGEKTYVINPSAETNLDGWAESTSGEVDLTRTDTGAELPREHTTGTGLKIVGTGTTDATSEYASYAFSLDDADKNRKLQIKFDQKPISGYTTGDFKVQIFANAVELTVPNSDITDREGSALYTFDSNEETSYELRITCTTTSSPGVVISDVVVGPGKVIPGAVVTEWKDFTPIYTAEGTALARGATDIDVHRFRRNGTDMEMKIQIRQTGAGTAGTLAYYLDIPDGLNLASWVQKTGSTSGATIGAFETFGDFRLGSGANAQYINGSVAVRSDTSVMFHFPDTTSYWGGSTTTDFSTDDMEFSAFIKIPIEEWQGSASANFINDEVAKSNARARFYRATNEGPVTLIGFDTESSKITNDGYSVSSGEVTVPSAGVYQITTMVQSQATFTAGQVRMHIGGTFEKYIGLKAASEGVAFGSGFVQISDPTTETISVRLSSTENIVGNEDTTYIEIVRVPDFTAGQAVSFGQASATEYGLVKAEKQYVLDTDFTVSSTPAGWSAVRGIAIPYQTVDGAWRLKFNISASMTSATNGDFTIDGLLFTASSFFQACTASGLGDSYSQTSPNTGTVVVRYGSAQTFVRCSGDVEIQDKPTWAN